ncbi:MAG: hypothetical protein GX864_02670 [Mollicutes bacterium]|jgi:hypothetical protein|nr:hypothetical protein [Mollicutes bacterium]
MNLEEDYEFITERYLNIVSQYLVSENYQEGFKIIKATIEAYNDSGALNFGEELIDHLLKIGMYLRIIIRKSTEILKNEINEWKQNLEENNYYNNIYLEDIVLSTN